jgi:hypothetical protein
MTDRELLAVLFDAIAMRLQQRGLPFDRGPHSFSLSHQRHLLTIDGGTTRSFAVVVMEFNGPDRDMPSVFWIRRPRPELDLLEMSNAGPFGIQHVAAEIVNTFLRVSQA